MLPIISQISATARREAMAERMKQFIEKCRSPKTASKSEVNVRAQVSSLCAPISQSAMSSLRAGFSRLLAKSVRPSIEAASPPAHDQFASQNDLTVSNSIKVVRPAP